MAAAIRFRPARRVRPRQGVPGDREQQERAGEMNQEVDGAIAEGIEAGELKVEGVRKGDDRASGHLRGRLEPRSERPPVTDGAVFDDGGDVVELKRRPQAAPIGRANRQRKPQDDRRPPPGHGASA